MAIIQLNANGWSSPRQRQCVRWCDGIYLTSPIENDGMPMKFTFETNLIHLYTVYCIDFSNSICLHRASASHILQIDFLRFFLWIACKTREFSLLGERVNWKTVPLELYILVWCFNRENRTWHSILARFFGSSTLCIARIKVTTEYVHLKPVIKANENPYLWCWVRNRHITLKWCEKEWWKAARHRCSKSIECGKCVLNQKAHSISSKMTCEYFIGPMEKQQHQWQWQQKKQHKKPIANESIECSASSRSEIVLGVAQSQSTNITTQYEHLLQRIKKISWQSRMNKKRIAYSR